jgi:glycosyltransferase involved in cell wall biosynthesis
MIPTIVLRVGSRASDTDRVPRVLILITLAEPGGAQTYVANLLPALATRCEVVVGAYGEGPLRDAARDAGVRFVALRHVRRPLHPGRDLLGLFELVELMRRERPDLVHVNSSKAGVLGRLAALLARVPVRVFTVHGWAFKASTGLASRLYRWADRLMAPLASAIVCVSETERAAGLAARTCRAERTVVIPNAVDVGAAPRAAHAGDPPLIVTVGRLAAPKDPVTLLRALATVAPSPFTALLVGEGPDRPAVETEIRALGLTDSVELAGERRDVPALLATGDVFVLSSRSEGAPISILEAMAAGLPVVASDVGGVGELVLDGETGLLVPPGDPARLAEALQRLLRDPALRRRLGAAGHARARERFDLRPLQSAHLELYARELARRGVSVRMP